VVALLITMLFSIRFINVLPFSGFSRVFNQETIATLSSFLMYAQEPWSFPIGLIKGLSYPFSDGNIGNVGAIPLFALIFKAFGTLMPYFQYFDYFVLVDITSCFLTAYYSQKILDALQIKNFGFRALAALLTGTSFLVFNRSAWMQPFCIVAFPIFCAWIYAMLLTLRRGKWVLTQEISILSIYPLAALTDNYSLFAILLGTFVLMVREIYEAIFGGLTTSWSRCMRLFLFCVIGAALSVIALYMIGMYPLPSIPQSFSSYDFGMGGRYHVADLFSPWLPAANGEIEYFPEPSLLGRIGFPISTKLLADGQYEGIAYIGTSALLIWFFLITNWLRLIIKNRYEYGIPIAYVNTSLVLFSSWKKIAIACSCVFIFSLGYELHILGYAFPSFSGMPAAWIADRFPSVHNIRAQGRLASLLSLFLIIEGVRQLAIWCDKRSVLLHKNRSNQKEVITLLIILLLTGIHIIEIFAFFKPVPVQKTLSMGDWTEGEIAKIKQISAKHDALLIAPNWREGLAWETKIYSLAFYSGLRSNIYLIARTLPERETRISRDLDWVIRGEWEALEKEYGQNLLFAVPTSSAERLRSHMNIGYEEYQVGSLSLWSKRKKLK